MARSRNTQLTTGIRAAAAAHHGVIRRRALDAMGVSHDALRSRLASGTLLRRDHGVYVVPELTDEWTHLAILLARSDLLAVTHLLAAAVYRWDGFDRAPTSLLRDPYVVTPWTSRADLRAHRRRDLRRTDLVEVDGFRLTSPVWTLRRLGEPTVVSLERLEQAVECALRRGQVREDAMWAHVSACHGRAADLLRAVLALRGRHAPPTESMLETLALQLVLRKYRIHVLGRQVNVWESGQHRGRVDFLLDGWTVLELDGAQHDDEEHKAADRDRDRRLESLGLTVMRAGWLDVTGSVRSAGMLATQLTRVIEHGCRGHHVPPPFDGRTLRF